MKTKENRQHLLDQIAELRDQLAAAESTLQKLGGHPNQPTCDGASSHRGEPVAAIADLQKALQKERLQRELAEELHWQTERRYRALFNQMTEGFVLFEVIFNAEQTPGDLRVLEVNPAYERLTGRLREELIGKTFVQLFPGAKRDMIQLCGQIALTGEPAHFQNHDQEGQRYYEVFACSPLAGQCACILLDITRRKEAELALQSSQERLQLAVGATQLGTFDYQFQNKHLVCSEHARRHLRLQLDRELNPEEILERVSHLDRTRVEKTWEKALAGECDGYFAVEFRIKPAKNGDVRWVSVWGRLFTDSKGNPVRVTGVTLDITARNLATQDLRNAKMEAERRASELDAVLDAMIDGVAIFDPAGAPIKFNPAITAMLGVDLSNHDADTYLQAISRLNARYVDGTPVAPEGVPSRLALAGEQVNKLVFQITPNEGEPVVLEATAARLVSGTRVRGAVVVLRNVTVQRLADLQLQESERQLQALLRDVLNSGEPCGRSIGASQSNLPPATKRAAALGPVSTEVRSNYSG